MSDQHHVTTDAEGGSPMAEGLGEAGRGAAQVAAAAMMAMQMWTRVQDQREQARMVEDQQQAERARAELRTEQAAARLGWAPALERDFGSTATTADAMGAWAAAQPWIDHDPSAAEASRQAEARLDQLQPDLMAKYRAHTGAGLAPPAAMVEAGHDVDQARYQAFLPPEPMRGIDPGLYEVRNDLGVDDTLRAWDAARPWAARYPDASEAMGRAEEQLRRLRPAGMAQYDDARAMGAEPVDAMRAALPELRTQVWQDEVAVVQRLDSGQAEADRTVGDQQRAAAHDDFSQPDLASTPDVNERTTAAGHGADHQELSDARTAHADSLVGQAYPVTIHTALATKAGPAPAPAARLSRAAAPAPGRRR